MSDKKGERVRETIEKMLSTDEVGVEGDGVDQPGTLAEREPVADTGPDTAARAARAHVAEIERRVGQLIGDEHLEKDADEQERGARSGGARPPEHS